MSGSAHDLSEGEASSSLKLGTGGGSERSDRAGSERGGSERGDQSATSGTSVNLSKPPAPAPTERPPDYFELSSGEKLFSYKEVLTYAIAIAQGMEYLHSLPVIYRDLKVRVHAHTYAAPTAKPRLHVHVSLSRSAPLVLTTLLLLLLLLCVVLQPENVFITFRASGLPNHIGIGDFDTALAYSAQEPPSDPVGTIGFMVRHTRRRAM